MRFQLITIVTLIPLEYISVAVAARNVKGDTMRTRRIKTVKVSDPENFYQQDTIEVGIYITEPWQEKVSVRVFIYTVDDRAWALEQEIDAKYKEQIKFVYDHYKKWIYDKMPEEISLVWLYEHGFLPV